MGLTPGLLLGDTEVYPQGQSLRAQRHEGRSRGGGYAGPILVLTPPPGGLAPALGPAPRALPPTPGPDVQLAEASTGGGVLRPQPALLPCQQLHCVREERAAAESGRASGGSASAAGRASAPGRVRGGARGCAPPASRQLCSSAARRARRPAARAPAGWRGCRGVRLGRIPPLGTGHPRLPAEGRGARSGGHGEAALAGRTAWAGARRGSGAPRGQRAPIPPGGAPTPRGARSECAPRPRRPPRTPTSSQTFLPSSPVGVAVSARAALRGPDLSDPSHADLPPLVASVATSPGRAGCGTRGKRGKLRRSPKAPAPPRGSRAG